MKKEIYLTILFDYYGKLLTEQQRKYFTNYYFNNFSLGEISDSLGVSRNAIHKQLKVIADKLENYEEILHNYHKDRELLSIVNEMNDDSLKQKIINILNK